MARYHAARAALSLAREQAAAGKAGGVLVSPEATPRARAAPKARQVSLLTAEELTGDTRQASLFGVPRRGNPWKTIHGARALVERGRIVHGLGDRAGVRLSQLRAYGRAMRKAAAACETTDDRALWFTRAQATRAILANNPALGEFLSLAGGHERGAPGLDVIGAYLNRGPRWWRRQTYRTAIPQLVPGRGRWVHLAGIVDVLTEALASHPDWPHGRRVAAPPEVLVAAEAEDPSVAEAAREACATAARERIEARYKGPVAAAALEPAPF